MKEFVDKLLRTFKCEELQTELIAVSDVITIINKFVENNLANWVPVEKGLPEEKEVKIAGDIVTNSEIVWIALENSEEMYAYLEDGRWYSIGGELIKEKVVAWHPAYKPEEYKESKYSIFISRQQFKNV